MVNRGHLGITPLLITLVYNTLIIGGVNVTLASMITGSEELLDNSPRNGIYLPFSSASISRYRSINSSAIRS